MSTKLISARVYNAVQFDEDLVLVPPQSAWFQYYPDNDVTLCEVLPLNEVSLGASHFLPFDSVLSFLSSPPCETQNILLNQPRQ